MAGAANPNLVQAVGGSRPIPFRSLGQAPAETQPLRPAPIEMHSLRPAPAEMQSVGRGLGGAPIDPMQQASLAQRGALAGTATAGTIGGANLNQYMNPYTQNVIGGLQTEANRAMQMGSNQLGTAASRAGAFGGSRHGIAEGQMMGDVQRGLNQQTGQLLQSGYTNAQTMAQQDIQNRMNQAAQLANLGQQSFGYGRTIQQDIAQQGREQQLLNQALIDAAKQQYSAYQGFPAAGLSYMTQAIGSAPHGQTQTGSRQLGLMDYLTAGATAYGAYAASDVRLKTNIKVTGKLESGLNTYSWDWNAEGEKLTGDKSSSGVIAQEVAEMFPEAVITGDHGYMMVDYSHPELKGAI